MDFLGARDRFTFFMKCSLVSGRKLMFFHIFFPVSFYIGIYRSSLIYVNS